MPHFLLPNFIVLNWPMVLQVVALGFIGGLISGFIGSGGAFFLTPGLMNLGIPGVVTVGSNVAHKFGTALIGSKKHAEMGNVDKKLGIFVILTSFVGIRFAIWISMLVKGNSEADHNLSLGDAASNLYISAVFVLILSFVASYMLWDVLRSGKEGESGGPSTKLANFLAKLHLPPLISFPVADVKISLWILILVGLILGYLEGTLGVSGVVGMPAMIYIFGVPTAVATGTELYIATLMGAFTAVNYAYQGLVDIRLTLLLYLGSLLGVFIGAYGTKVVKEVMIRIVTGTVILLCVLSRGVAIPMYFRQLGWIALDPEWDVYLNQVSKGLLYLAGLSGALLILYIVIKAYRQRRRIRTTLIEAKEVPERA